MPPIIEWAWRWTLGYGVQQGMGRVSVAVPFQDAICYFLSTELQ